MSQLRRADDALYVHFITFSCYHRRRLLELDQPKRILLGILTDEMIKFEARCIGFVIMPGQLHALLSGIYHSQVESRKNPSACVWVDLQDVAVGYAPDVASPTLRHFAMRSASHS